MNETVRMPINVWFYKEIICHNIDWWNLVVASLELPKNIQHATCTHQLIIFDRISFSFMRTKNLLNSSKVLFLTNISTLFAIEKREHSLNNFLKSQLTSNQFSIIFIKIKPIPVLELNRHWSVRSTHAQGYANIRITMQ